MTPILIAIPFWQGDNSQAIELCKIIAGLQAGHAGNTAHIMLVCRQDWAIDQNMVKIISQKFNTLTFKSNSPLKGWPSGSNGMFASTMRQINQKLSKNYECVYWMEPDAIPIVPNWFWCLVEEWRKRHPAANIVGCRSDCNGDGTGDHITGCALYHPTIAKIMPELMLCDGQAWDYKHRAKIVSMGQHTKTIENWYRANNAAPGILDRTRVGVVIIHGFKDSSVVNLVKKKYKIS